MDKVEKLFRKILKKDRQQILATMFLIEKKEMALLDVKKLEGGSNRYRARVGKYRVVFKKEGKQNIVIEVNLRNEKTYSNLS